MTISPEALEKARSLLANYGSDPDGLLVGAIAAALQSQAARIAELEAGLDCLVNAKALSGVRELVAGWNGERRPEGPYTERHPARLGATLPKTNCGAVYALDDAMQTARSLLNKDRQP